MLIWFRNIMLLVIFLLLAACEQAYMRPYLKHENSFFRSIELPFADDIRKYSNNSNTLKLNQPLADVWPACLSIVVQGGGVVSIDSENPKQKGLLFISREPFHYEPEVLQKFAGRIQRANIEIWQAIVVTEQEDGGTEIVTWWINPKTGLLYDFSINERDDDVLFYENIATRAIGQFLYAVKTQLSIAEDLKKFKHARKYQRSDNKLDLILKEEKEPWGEYAYKYGNYLSLLLRSKMYVLDTHDVDTDIYEVVNDLADVMGLSNLNFNIYIVAEQLGMNAYVLSNGDIFISSMLLETLENTDQLAGLLAHELDHFQQMDVMRRMRHDSRSKNIKFNVLMFAVLAPAIIGIINNPDAWFSFDQDEMYSTDALANRGVVLLAILAGIAAAIYAGAEFGEHYSAEYSKEQEFRADHNATLYLYQAGYDYHAWKIFLTYLIESNAKKH